MKSETSPPVLPAAGGSYRLDGDALTRVATPTRVHLAKTKSARFVGGGKAETPMKAGRSKARMLAQSGDEPVIPAADEAAVTNQS